MSIASGTLAAVNAGVTLATSGGTEVAAMVLGTFVGTITFSGTVDGSTWFNINVVPLGGGNPLPNLTTTSNGVWRFGCAGFQSVRAVMTAYTSGAVTVTLNATLSDPSDITNVVAASPSGALADASTLTITAPNTSQNVFAANSARKYLVIQNQSTSVLWINFTANANQAQPSIQISGNGGAFEFPPGFISTEAVNIIGATGVSGQAFWLYRHFRGLRSSAPRKKSIAMRKFSNLRNPLAMVFSSWIKPLTASA